MMAGVRKKLQALVGSPIAWDCPLREYTSFNIGGPAAALIIVQDLPELTSLLQFFVTENIKWHIIGRGTNLLVSDAGFKGVILLLGQEFSTFFLIGAGEHGSHLVQAGAGCSLTRLVNWCLEQRLAGLEFLAGIPGSIGGAVVMNAGAWGRELSDVLVAVTFITSSGQVSTVPRAQLAFGYRIWHDLHDNELTIDTAGAEKVVINVSLQLQEADPAQMRALCQSYRDKRQMTQPRGEPNAGSFFKNPPGDAAGRLIEASGLKGLTIGGAMVSVAHANFLVNIGGATAADVLELMAKVQSRVQEDSGILLEPEVHFL